MNKTEPGRAGEELRDLGSSVLPKFGTAGLTKFDSSRTGEAIVDRVRTFKTSGLPDSATAELPMYGTSRLATGLGS